jgi:hypothetical protein
MTGVEALADTRAGMYMASPEKSEAINQLALTRGLTFLEAVERYQDKEVIDGIEAKANELNQLIDELFSELKQDEKALIISHDLSIIAAMMKRNILPAAVNLLEGFVLREDGSIEPINNQAIIKPNLIGEFEFHGHVDVEWYDVSKKEDIPDLPWQQVYVVGDFEGKVPIVTYLDAQDNLPGGKTEPGESLEQTMFREIEEETNMQVLGWEPLGYQACTRRDTGETFYQFRAYAKLEKIGEFVNDPDGKVLGYKVVELETMNDYIGYGVVGDRLAINAKRYFSGS